MGPLHSSLRMGVMIKNRVLEIRTTAIKLECQGYQIIQRELKRLKTVCPVVKNYLRQIVLYSIEPKTKVMKIVRCVTNVRLVEPRLAMNVFAATLAL